MSYRCVLLSQKEPEAFHDDHEGQDEELVDEGRQGVPAVSQTVALRQEDAELDHRVKAEVENVDVQ